MEVIILIDCFNKPSGLYRYSSFLSLSSPAFSKLPQVMSGVLSALDIGARGTLPPARFPSISRHVKKPPEIRLALHDLSSVHRRMPVSRSSHTNVEPDRIVCRSFFESRLCARGNRPIQQASKRILASADVRTWP